jgi:hypothetical protein
MLTESLNKNIKRKNKICDTMSLPSMISKKNILDIDMAGVQHVWIISTTFCFMKGSIFWDIMQCNLVKVTNVSEEHIASIFQALLAVCFMLVSCWAYTSTLKMVICLPKMSAFTGLHSVISLKTELFTAIAVRTLGQAFLLYVSPPKNSYTLTMPVQCTSTKFLLCNSFVPHFAHPP